MGCPHLDELLKAAVSGCPFLRELKVRHGEGYAQQIAVQPARPATSQRCPVLEEGLEGYASTFALFHGASGLVPLTRTQCPVTGHQPEQASSPLSGCDNGQEAADTACPAAQPAPRQAKTAPFAAISISLLKGLPGYSDLFKGRQRRRRPQPQQEPASSSTGQPPGPGGFLQGASLLGALTPYKHNGSLACPPAIVALRSAVASIPAVRVLRPKALTTRLVAVGLAVGLLNAPFGAAREHCAKFSPEWFVAVHATIPLVAALRKALLMPKWAIALTVASTIAGQTLGSRLERRRIVSQQAERARQLRDRSEQRAVQPAGLSLGVVLQGPDWAQPSFHLHDHVPQNALQRVSVH